MCLSAEVLCTSVDNLHMDAEEYYVISTPVKNTIFCLLLQAFTYSFFGESGEKNSNFWWHVIYQTHCNVNTLKITVLINSEHFP